MSIHAHDEATVGGSLEWRERKDGHWFAAGLGGHFELVPARPGYRTWWMGRDRQHIDLGHHGTLGGAMGAAKRFADREQIAAENPAGGCAHTHPASVPSKPCPEGDPSAMGDASAVVVVAAGTAVASESVPVIYESGSKGVARDAGAYATVERDREELVRGKKLGEVTTPRMVFELLKEPISKESQEVFLVLLLDLRGELMSRPVEIARGQRDRVEVSNADIFRPVQVANARGFVMVHNHPSGHAKPSKADRQLTESVKKECPADIRFVDHVIVSSLDGKNGEYFSFSENKLTRVRV